MTAPSLDWDLDVAVRHVGAADPKLGALIARVGPCGLVAEPRKQLFQGLTESIVYQQLSGKAAATILGRVVALYRPKRFPRPEDILATPDATLRAAGLSTAKTAALKDLAAHCIDGRLPTLARLRAHHDHEIVDIVTKVRGIGRWSAEMLLMFRLGRPDVLPIHDLGVQKGFQRTYGLRKLPKPERIERHAEAWRPYRTVGSWYMWRALEL